MNTETIQSTDYHARRKKYIDTNIQGRLIAALVLIELLMFTLAMWFVYQELQSAIDTNLYRIHQPDSESRPILLTALLQATPWILVVNLVLLVIIDRFWNQHLEKILEPLHWMMERVHRLDLSKMPHISTEHAVLEHAYQWREQERQRCEAIRAILLSLPSKIENTEVDDVKAKLAVMKRQLPKL